MLKMSYAGCPDPSSSISAQFTVKMCVAAKNRKNRFRGQLRLVNIMIELR